jgi:Uncharacterised protein family (UPF0158)
MALTVSLQAVVRELEGLPTECVAHLHRETGEIITLSDEDYHLVEDEVDPANLPAWQREFLPKVREVVEGESYLALPTSFDINGYQIMKRFCGSVQDPQWRHELYDAIRGRGAFRNFKGTVRRLGLEDDWYRYRLRELEEIAVSWLEANGIAYER